MSFFDYVTAMALIAALAVFVLVFNLLMIVNKLVQVHALIAGGRGYSFSAKWNVRLTAVASVAIYWHLFIPGPGV